MLSLVLIVSLFLYYRNNESIQKKKLVDNFIEYGKSFTTYEEKMADFFYDEESMVKVIKNRSFRFYDFVCGTGQDTYDKAIVEKERVLLEVSCTEKIKKKIVFNLKTRDGKPRITTIEIR